MTGISTLLLPILLSAVFVFLVSWVIHVFLPWHKGDYATLPNEDKVRDALRPFGIPPGDYMVPRPSSPEEMRSPAYLDKLKQGPVMVVTVLPNAQFSMAKNLVGWFVYSLVVGLFAAYVTGRALPPASPYLAVFRFAGVTAFLGYSLALWQMSIWYQRSWATTIKSTIDGLVYGLLTAGTFGWLWPK